MNRNLLAIFLMAAVYCAACKKGADVNPMKTADTYFPIIAGSKWQYLDLEAGLNIDTATSTITGATTVFNNKTYYNVATSSTHKGGGTDYFYTGDHVYVMRSLNAYAGTTIDLQLYNDTATVGVSHLSIPTDNGLVDGLRVQTVNTIIEKDIPLTINNINYKDVVHTQVAFQYEYENGDGFQTNFLYDFYLAKNIGMIAYKLNIAGIVAEQEVLIQYSLK